MLFHLQTLKLLSTEFGSNVVMNSVYLTIWKRWTQTEQRHELFFI
jgi:hypothetical protein